MSVRRRHPLYARWRGMRTRCRNPHSLSYANYGGRGIKVCSRWDNFDLFASDVGLPPYPGHTLDRINHDGHYEPGNVRWATRRVQNRNRSGNILITHDGETKSLGEWAEDLGVSPFTLYARHARGEPGDRLLNPAPLIRSGGLSDPEVASALDLRAAGASIERIARDLHSNRETIRAVVSGTYRRRVSQQPRSKETP